MQRRRLKSASRKQFEEKSLQSEFIGYQKNDNDVEKLAYVVDYREKEAQYFVLFLNDAIEEALLALNPDNARILTCAQIRRMCDPHGFDRSIKAKLKCENVLVERVQKRRRSIRLESIKAQDISQQEEMSNRDLIGSCIVIRVHRKKPRLYALVVGYQSPDLHKLYFFNDHEYDDTILKKRDWLRVPKGMEPWDADGLVGCRIYFMEHPEYLDSFELKTSPTPTTIPCLYEAFAVSNSSPGRYRLFVTKKNYLIEMNLEIGSDKWDLLQPGTLSVKGKPIESWSSWIE